MLLIIAQLDSIQLLIFQRLLCGIMIWVKRNSQFIMAYRFILFSILSYIIPSRQCIGMGGDYISFADWFEMGICLNNSSIS